MEEGQNMSEDYTDSNLQMFLGNKEEIFEGTLGNNANINLNNLNESKELHILETNSNNNDNVMFITAANISDYAQVSDVVTSVDGIKPATYRPVNIANSDYQHNVLVEEKNEIVEMAIIDEGKIATSEITTLQSKSEDVDPNYEHVVSETTIAEDNDTSEADRQIQMGLSKIGNEYEDVEALKFMKTQNFKICKMIRKADGSTQCLETNLQDIATADRAVVCRAMFENIPNIVNPKQESISAGTEQFNCQLSQHKSPPKTSNPQKFISILRKPLTNEVLTSTDNIRIHENQSAAISPRNVKHDEKTNRIADKCQKISSKAVAKTIHRSKNIQPQENEKHQCKSERYFECINCHLQFKTENDFLKHAAMNYLKVLPNLFAHNVKIECLLCAQGKTIMDKLIDARDHLRIHELELTTKCDFCSQSVARDHLYATKENVLDTPVVEEGDVDMGENVITIGDTNDEELAKKGESEIIAKEEVLSKNSPIKIYKCRYCDKQFKKRNICKMHVYAHIGLQPISCPLCTLSFNRKQSLQLHMKSHAIAICKRKKVEKPLPYKLEKTNEITNTESTENSSVTDDNDNDLVINETNPVKCEECELELENPRKLIIHKYRVHKRQAERTLVAKETLPKTCSDCGKIFRGVGALKLHQRRNCGQKEVLCEICGKIFPVGRALSNHKYQCHKLNAKKLDKKENENISKKTNSLDGDRTENTKIYESEETTEKGTEENLKSKEKLVAKKSNKYKPKTCEHCGFVAASSSSLRAHLVSKHKYPKLRARIYNYEPIKCEKCGLLCKGMPALKLHKIRFCLAGKTLICPICSKTFQDRKKYSSHKYNHTYMNSENRKKWQEKRKERLQAMRLANGLETKETLQDQALNISNTEEMKAVASVLEDAERNLETNAQIIFDNISNNNSAGNLQTNVTLDSNSPLLQYIDTNYEANAQTVQVEMGEETMGETTTLHLADPLQQPQQAVNYYQLLVMPNGDRFLKLMPQADELNLGS